MNRARGTDGVDDRELRHLYRRFCRLTHESTRDPEYQRRFEHGFSGLCCSESLEMGEEPRRKASASRLVVLDRGVGPALLPGELDILSLYRNELIERLLSR